MIIRSITVHKILVALVVTLSLGLLINCTQSYDEVTITWADGRKYEGQFKDGKRHGEGTQTWSKVEAHLKNTRIWDNGHMETTIAFSDGREYIEASPRKGFRRLEYWPDGREYVGQWKNDQPHGQGTVTWPDGSKYVGQWKNGFKHGNGTRIYRGGGEYVGRFKYGQAHGQGTMTWSDGFKYVGQWKDGNEHGQGTLYDSNGNIIQKGIWLDGGFVSGL